MRPNPSIIWLKNNWKFFFVLIVPLLLAIMPIVGQYEEAKCGYVILVMAFYWMTEVIPMAVTSLIPVFAFPLFGILSTAECCLVYMKATNMMFLGGLIVAVCVEHCNLHKRIALLVILRIGQSPARLMAGFMIVTTFLSMWISNTATTAMMVPIVNAILDELYPACNESPHDKEDEIETSDDNDKNKLEMVSAGVENHGYVTDNPRVQVDAENGESASKGNLDIVTKSTKSIDDEKDENRDNKPKKTERDFMARALLLGVAYSSNTGGTGVITGTAPNLVMMSVLESSFSQPSGLNFATWILFNVPGMLICNLLAWIWLQILFMGLGCKKGGIQKPTTEQQEAVKRLISRKYKELGRITQHEITVLLLFFLLVALWIFRAPGFIAGWSAVFTHNKSIDDATPVMLIVFFLFALPSRFEVPWSQDYRNNPPKKGPQPCLTWAPVHEKVPWNVVLLLGGGFAIAEAAKQSGLSAWLGLQFEGLQVLPKEAIVLLISLLTAMITEVASNTATASVLLPVLKAMALKIRVNPLYLMLPATICCSYAFMLPVATAPNAIVFNAVNMKTTDMMKAGFVMNILCILVINIMINTLGVYMFDLHNMPSWTAT